MTNLDQWNGGGAVWNGMREKITGQYGQVDDTVFNGDVYFGAFSERVLTALVEQDIIQMDDSADQVLPTEKPSTKERARTFEDMNSFEERIKQELRFIGVIGEDDVAQESTVLQEDEITRELIKAQSDLKKVIKINNERKQKLEKVAKKWMALFGFN